MLKDSLSNRKDVLGRAQDAYERYLTLLDTYGMLSSNDRMLHERFIDDRDHFSLVSSNEPSARRDAKILRYKQENDLKLKLEVGKAFVNLDQKYLICMLVYLEVTLGTSMRQLRVERSDISRNPTLCPSYVSRC